MIAAAFMLPQLLTLARAALPLVAHGSSEAATVAKTTLTLIDKFTAEEPKVATTELKRTRDELEVAVKAHAKRTAAALRG